jgi:hypothetical protein
MAGLVPAIDAFVALQAGRDCRKDLQRDGAVTKRRTAIDTALCAIAVAG